MNTVQGNLVLSAVYFNSCVQAQIHDACVFPLREAHGCRNSGQTHLSVIFLQANTYEQTVAWLRDLDVAQVEMQKLEFGFISADFFRVDTSRHYSCKTGVWSWKNFEYDVIEKTRNMGRHLDEKWLPETDPEGKVYKTWPGGVMNKINPRRCSLGGSLRFCCVHLDRREARHARGIPLSCGHSAMMIVRWSFQCVC